ncbi:MAG: CvpA family protein [Kiritimatiellae bacterium]|nr:CvpA family protein [Kiritimatiellia bacterium]
MQSLAFISIVDLVALAFIVLSTIVGYIRGLSGEIARLVGMVAAFVMGVVTYDPVAVWLAAHSRLEERSARAVTFIAIVLTSIVAMFILRFVCKHVMRLVIDESFDKKGGMLAAILHSSLLVFMVFVAMNLWPSEDLNRRFGEDSVIGRLTLRMMPVLKEKFEQKLEEQAG